MRACEDLLNQDGHIRNVIHVQSLDQIAKNRLRLKTSIDTVRYLTLQACAFRGHDETSESRNQDNFLEMIKLLASYNDEVANVVLENAPYNSKYTSHRIQKEILHILSCKVKSYIREELGDSKFCIVVDEARDESKKEQMALVLRFVDKNGFIQERFFDIVHVRDTMALTLKKELCAILSQHNLNVSNIRGQGYNGASNMRGEWNGLQALFLNDCTYAYYVHCFAHRLQLALVAASREVIPIHQFFSKLTFIFNIVCSSSKRHDDLQAEKLDEIAHLLEIDELETGRGANQIGTLKRASDTRWSSHFSSLCSLIDLYAATCSVLEKIIVGGSTYSQRGDADNAYKSLTSFDFILILHLMREIMGITDVLSRHGRSRNKENITIEHYFRVEVFFVTVDKQLQELNNRFNDQAVELLTLSSALVPKDAYQAFNIDNICTLVEKYYPMDFNEQEKINLRFQLRHFIIDARKESNLQNLSTIQELCACLASTKKSEVYYLFDRLLRLIMTLPVSTATTEISFSAMKIIKTRLRNRMEADFLADSMIVHIEREIATCFSSDSIIEDFKSLKERRAALWLEEPDWHGDWHGAG